MITIEILSNLQLQIYLENLTHKIKYIIIEYESNKRELIKIQPTK